MEKKLTITIIDNRATAYFRATWSAMLLVLLPILVGILCNSAAMQWAGFVFGFLTFFGLVARLLRQSTSHTLSEARQFLDALEISTVQDAG